MSTHSQGHTHQAHLLQPGHVQVNQTAAQVAEIIQGVPTWESDENVTECFICQSKFSFFNRKHHCRKCGRIACASCSSIFTKYLPSTYVVSPPSQIFLESPHVPHRTCDHCVEELEMLRAALADGSLSSSTGDNASIKLPRYAKIGPSTTRTIDLDEDTPPCSSSSAVDIPGENTDDQSEDEGLCPVCFQDIKALSESLREKHIDSCLTGADFSRSPDSKRKVNRMLVFEIPKSPTKQLDIGSIDTIVNQSSSSVTGGGAGGLTAGPSSSLSTIVNTMEKLKVNSENEKIDEENECEICFEAFEPGQKIARFECLCVFHLDCITSWFAKRGTNDCPVHQLNYYD